MFTYLTFLCKYIEQLHKKLRQMVHDWYGFRFNSLSAEHGMETIAEGRRQP